MRIITTFVPTPAGFLGLGGCSASAYTRLPVGSVALPAVPRLRGSRMPALSAFADAPVRVRPDAGQPVAVEPTVPTQGTVIAHTDATTLGFHPSGRPLS